MKKIIGCLVKYNTPWFNGTIIAPGAFKDCDEKVVPICSSFDKKYDSEYIVGYVTLKCKSDGIYYEGFLNDAEEANKIFKQLFDNKDEYHVGLYAHHIEKNDNAVTDGRIVKVAFSPKTDEASFIDEIIDE